MDGWDARTTRSVFMACGKRPQGSRTNETLDSATLQGKQFDGEEAKPKEPQFAPHGMVHLLKEGGKKLQGVTACVDGSATRGGSSMVMYPLPLPIPKLDGKWYPCVQLGNTHGVRGGSLNSHRTGLDLMAIGFNNRISRRWRPDQPLDPTSQVRTDSNLTCQG